MRRRIFHLLFVLFRRVTEFQRFDDPGPLGLKLVLELHLPLFELLSKKRPKYPDFLQWVDVPAGQDDPLTLLARTEGIRETDTLAVFPCPERGKDNIYRVTFFSHGLRYLSAGSIERMHNLQPGEQLFLMVDPQNSYDPWAVALRTGDPIALVGFCSRYFAQTFRSLLERGDLKVEAVVERVNLDAPTQLRLLCRLTPRGRRTFIRVRRNSTSR